VVAAGVSRRCSFLHMVVMAAPMVVVHVHMHMHVMVVMPHSHGLCRFRGIRNRLHGDLSGRRPPDERCDGERRYGDAWKLHVFSLFRWIPSPTHKSFTPVLE